jgi:hypothetical protein
MTSAMKPLMVAGISAMLATAAGAQEVDWAKVRCRARPKGCRDRRRTPLCVSTHRPERDAGRRDDQAGAGLGWMGIINVTEGEQS